MGARKVAKGPPVTLAVMTCPDSGSSEYFGALRRANPGKDLPMESKDEFQQRIRARRPTSR
jgi:hypothetical protein